MLEAAALVSIRHININNLSNSTNSINNSINSINILPALLYHNFHTLLTAHKHMHRHRGQAINTLVHHQDSNPRIMVRVHLLSMHKHFNISKEIDLHHHFTDHMAHQAQAHAQVKLQLQVRVTQDIHIHALLLLTRLRVMDMGLTLTTLTVDGT
ncbi:hypothetical protein BGZ52_010795, partial [Haplosporangium bisporale]